VPALACECGVPAPACAYVDRTAAVFIGKVAFTDDDGSGKITQKTLVRFEVEESFKGLPKGTRDVWIDPGSFTSCYATYRIGERWLVFAYQGRVSPVDTAAMTVISSGRSKAKPLPPGFDPKNPPNVYSAPECSGTRILTPETELTTIPEFEYLRQYRAGTATSSIIGQQLKARSQKPISKELQNVYLSTKCTSLSTYQSQRNAVRIARPAQE
jgi:hypothetical protein